MDGTDSTSAAAKRVEGAAVAEPATSTPSISSISSIAPVSPNSPANSGAPAPGSPGALSAHLHNWGTRHVAHAPFAVWLLGVAGFAAYVLTRYARFSRRLRDADEVTEGPLRVELERLAARLGKADPPELLLSTAVSSPLLCGLFRPRIVLPANLPDTLSADDLSNVLLHELIHWRRRDVAVGWLQLTGQALFWFHPLVWLANARARHERECACDEAALAIGRCAPKAYGESLLKVLLASEGRSAAALGFLGIFERGTRIQNRLEAIMNHSVRSRRANLIGWFGLAVFALICLPMFPAAKATGQNPAGTTLSVPAPSKDPLRIIIAKKQTAESEERIYLKTSKAANERKVGLKELRDEAAQAKKADPDLKVVIEPDKEASASVVTRVLAALREAQIDDIDVSVRPDNKEQTPAQQNPAKTSDLKDVTLPKPAATGSSEGTVKYGADIPLSLTVGGDPYPRLMVSKVRFEKRGGSVTAVVPYGYDSGPKAKWKMAVEILGKEDGAVIVRSEGECENWGAIAGAPVSMAGEKMAPMELALGESGKIPADARFRLRIEYFPQFLGESKGAVATSFVGTDGPVEFGKEIPLSLTLGESPCPRASSIRFEKRGTTAAGVVHYTCHSGPKAKWTMVLQVTGKDGTEIAREEKVCENSGLIRTVPFPMSGDVEFALGESGKIPAVASFHLKILRSPEAPANPTVSAKADGTPAQPASAPPAANGTPEPQRAAIESTAVALKYDEDIPLQLSVGEPPVPNFKATSIRFEKRDGAAVGILRYVTASGPKAKWRVTLGRITGWLGDYIVTGAPSAEKEFENSGVIRRTAMLMPGQMEFSLGDASKISADAKFRLTVECFPEALATPASSFAMSTSPKVAATLSYVHDTADGKRSLGASGHAVEFARPDKGRFVEAVRIYASRYGLPEAPQEDFHVYLLNADKQVLADLKYPYSMVERGDMKWVELRTPSVEVPERFLVALAFNPAQTKGIYLGLDEAAEGGHSFTGLPDSGFEKWGEKPNEKGDWMVRVDLAESPSGAQGVQRLADWKAPVSTDPFAACNEAKYDAGESDDKQSYGGSGPAIQLRLSDFGLAQPAPSATAGQGGGAAAVGVPAPVGNPRLIGFRLYAGRYGSGYDPAQTDLKVAILDSANQVRWQGAFPYALFAYKSKWVDLVLKEPLAVHDLAGDDGILTIAFDPEATQFKGVYFHYNKNPQTSHSFAGTVARGFQPVADREWAIRAYFESAKPGAAMTVRAGNEVALAPAQNAAPSKRPWGPEQATGAPDTTRSGDIETAWASLEPDRGPEWLELDYASPLRANQVRIAETFNPGAVTALVLKDDQNTTISVVQVTDGTTQAPAFLEVPFALTQRPVKSVRVVLDTRKVPGWNEIDAVELVGPEGRGWAAAARASSTFAERTATGAGREPVFQVQFGSGGPGNAVRPWNGTAADPSKRAWGPEQATGAPDTTAAGDIETAWASLEQDLGAEWLELDYAPALRANQVRIAETFNPGAVTALVLKDDQDTTIGVVQVSDTTTQAPAFLEVPFALTQRPVKSVRVVLDTRKVLGWNEIDAVELVGPDGRGWAAAARASSTFAERTVGTSGAARNAVATQGEPPRVVATTPAVATTDVDPATAEITVTFDRDMAGGFSWMSYGEYYPTTPGGTVPSWRDRRTCVLPVRLEAGHFYRLGINSASNHGFCDVQNVPATPFDIYFVTKGAADEVKALAQKPVVVTMEPANGATNVDSKTTELRVTFNVPMDVTACSWCGDGPSFPVIAGKIPQWSPDRKTAILPVRLQPGWTYRLFLNAPSFKGFANAVGVAPEPVAYTFTTAASATAGNAATPPPAAGASPRIVATTPAVGATDVDPATAEITVTFDRDMAGGFSWTGGGEYYPKFPEGAKPSWRDKRTGILPVKLEAGHFYRVGINAPSFGNFRSAEGVSAPPSAITFATKGATDEVKALAKPPQVVKMEPANRATDVDPKTTELRVTFNVPMGGGNSWCGGGPSFPTIPEGQRASWSEDHKTAILPVVLQPGKTYSLSLNAASFKNFTNAAGVALEPVPYSFTTGK